MEKDNTCSNYKFQGACIVLFEVKIKYFYDNKFEIYTDNDLVRMKIII